MNTEALLAEIKVMRTRLLKLGLFFCAAAGVQAQIRTVPSPQYPTIQAAIDNALSGDAVVVNPGTYFENINFLGKAITVRSIDPDDLNTVSSTIINGSQPADPNKASVITFNHGEGNNSILTGFTITGGTGSWVVIAWRYGGIYWNRCGGGVVCYNFSAPTIRKNRFIANITGEGGGVYVYGNPVNPAGPSNPPVHLQPVIADNVFEQNLAIENHGYLPPNSNYEVHNHGDGGAIVCFQGVDANISGNIIQNNHADSYGGGIHLRQWSNGLIEQNTILNNTCTLGGGVHMTYNSSPVVKYNFIKGNITAGSGGGAAIYVFYYSNPIIEYNHLTENTDKNSAGVGIYSYSNTLVQNNVIIKNYGPGITINSTATAMILNNTIVSNYKNLYCMGIRCDGDSFVTVKNNVIANHAGGYGIYCYSALAPQTIAYNDVWNNSKGNYSPDIGDQTGVNGNISADPNFADPNDFHILPVSPCVNSGDPAASFPPDATDFDGEGRVFNGRVDIGADEMHLIPADFNTDGVVNEADLLTFCDYWISSTPPLQADFTGSGRVNLSDFAEFSACWLQKAFWRP